MLRRILLHTTPYYILYKGETKKNEHKKSPIKDIIIISDNELQNQIHTTPQQVPSQYIPIRPLNKKN